MQSRRSYDDGDERGWRTPIGSELAPGDSINARRHWHTLGMGVPLPNIVHHLPSCLPGKTGSFGMACRLSHKRKLPSAIRRHWPRRHRDFNVLAAPAPNEYSTAFRLPEEALAKLREYLYHRWCEDDKSLVVWSDPFAYELHAGHVERRSMSASAAAGLKPGRVMRVRRRGLDDPAAQSATISAARHAA